MSSDTRVEDKGAILEAYGKEFDLSRAWQFVEIFTLDLPPETREGQLVVSTNIIETTVAGQYGVSFLDLRYVGAAGAAENVLKFDTCSAAVNVSTCPIPAEGRWQRVAVRARLSLDGVFGDAASYYASFMPSLDNIAKATVVGRFRKEER